jgi:branched-chain amino acid transport system ATP-binding protein
MLEVRDLRARHGAVHVLRGVSLTVDPGEVVAVVGANGAGKTTLARAITGLHRQRSGQVLLAGRDLGGTSSPVSVARAGVTLVPTPHPAWASAPSSA